MEARTPTNSFGEFIHGNLHRPVSAGRVDVNDREFLRRARRYARRRRLDFRFDPDKGKGSHGELWVGGRKATIQRGEIPTGTLMAMLKQLQIDRRDF